MKFLYLFLSVLFCSSSLVASPWAPSSYGASGGVNLVEDRSVEDVCLRFSPGVFLNGEAAWQLHRHLYATAEINFRYNTHSLLVVGKKKSPLYSFELDGSLCHLQGAANLLYSPFTWYGLSPYLGCGGGYLVCWEEFTLLPIYTDEGLLVFDSYSHMGPSWVPQYIVGVAYNGEDNDTLGVEFRHRLPIGGQKDMSFSLTLGKAF